MELFRDTATFEMNYSVLNKRKFFLHIDDLSENIQNLTNEISFDSKNDSVKSWLNEDQLNDL